MAAPTPVTKTVQDGHDGMIFWQATWATTDNFTDTVVLDLSALTYTNQIVITRIVAWHTTGMTLAIEFDDDSADEPVFSSPEGHVDTIDLDFTWQGHSGLAYAGTGGTGDVVLTTTGVASGDFAWVMIYYRNT